MKATLGGAVGIAACALIAQASEGLGGLHLFLVAPLGASAVLVFAAPNSPLAQPWSAVAGNTLAAVCGVLAALFLEPWLAPAVAVGMAFAAMMLGRALHPPGGAVALLIALEPQLVAQAGALQVCLNVAVMTAALVATGLAYHRFSGRKYPLRNSLAKSAAAGNSRLGLSKDELTDLLARFHQSANLGAVDLGRLLAAAEEEAIHHRFGDTTCGEVMSRNIATVAPDAAFQEIVRRFRQTAEPALPVIGDDGRVVGVVTQQDVLAQLARCKNLRLFTPANSARDLMRAPDAVVEFDTPLGEVVTMMIRQRCQLVPVTENGVLKGLLTRSGLLDVILLSAAERKAA
ncbi:HPP family protein [Roseibium salinum]|uniref:HPP family protein n=1 Tax=Roseibium salinum TaxID=1604349 RepID=A0ABT3R1L5_9HYPH|nr:HPP family protein [Roseibium sp. DSM 29163]MCX2723144.1 HPP family protein [Roseibium sp. DSM 29163]